MKYESAKPAQAPSWDLELLVSYVLIGGVLLSLGLILVGAVAYALAFHNLSLAYSLPKEDLLAFLRLELGRLVHGQVDARDLINLGMITLMLTPFVRVLLSALFFAAVERNRKYTLITGFVLVVLTISLFLRLG